MDTAVVAAAASAALAPFLGLLNRVGERAAEEAGNRISADGWNLAKRLWAQLRGHVEKHDDLRKAVQDFAAVPADPGARKAFHRALELRFTTNPGLEERVIRLLQDDQHMSQQANIANELNIGVQATQIANSRIKAVGKQVDTKSNERDPGAAGR